MSPSNSQVTMITIGCVLLYTVTLLLFVFNFLGVEGILAMNIASSFLVLFYWVAKQFRITTHYFELREMVGLGAEVLVFGLSLIALLYRPSMKWLAIPAYIFFGLHFIALTLFLIFALTFKMKRLF